MSAIRLFDTKEQLLSFRDTVGTVLSDELSTRIKGRRLDELSARLLGAPDFNTALGLVDQNKALVKQPLEALRAALLLVLKSRDYLAEHGFYPQAMVDMMGDDAAIDDFLADIAENVLETGKAPDLDLAIFEIDGLRFPAKVSMDRAGTLPHRVSNHLEQYFHHCHGFAQLHGHFHAMSWDIEPPVDCAEEFKQGWKIANRLAIHGLLNIDSGAGTHDQHDQVDDDQAPGFLARQKRQRELLQKDIDNVTNNEQLLNINLVLKGSEVEYRWACHKGRSESIESWPTKEEALLDGMKSMGGFGFCNQSDFEKIYKTEGWFFDFFETEKEGLGIQLMGSEPEEAEIPALTDEQAWEWVAKKAMEQSIIHVHALAWLEEVSPAERQRIREHTGF
jgi:hypothetical protein